MDNYFHLVLGEEDKLVRCDVAYSSAQFCGQMWVSVSAFSEADLIKMDGIYIDTSDGKMLLVNRYTSDYNGMPFYTPVTKTSKLTVSTTIMEYIK